MNRLNFLLTTIREIGEFQMQYFGKEMEFSSKRHDLDLVSFVDIESQKMFTERVKQNFPDDVVMGEEDYTVGYDYSEEKSLWIIDPVDGTLLFKKGIPLFGIMVAYVKNGKVEHSAILLPALNELYHADETGTYKNGETISVSKVEKLSSSLLNLADYALHKFFHEIEEFKNLRANIGVAIDMYAAAYVLTACASGKIDGGAFYPNYGGIWDTIPGGFLVQQAGGKVTTIGQDTWNIWSKNIIYSNGNIHEDLQKALGV